MLRSLGVLLWLFLWQNLHWYSTSSVQAGCCDTTLEESRSLTQTFWLFKKKKEKRKKSLVSNLPFVLKILEKIVLARMQKHLSENNHLKISVSLLKQLQSWNCCSVCFEWFACKGRRETCFSARPSYPEHRIWYSVLCHPAEKTRLLLASGEWLLTGSGPTCAAVNSYCRRHCVLRPPAWVWCFTGFSAWACTGHFVCSAAVRRYRCPRL